MRANPRENLLRKSQLGQVPIIVSLPELGKSDSLGIHKRVEPPRRILGEGREGKAHTADNISSGISICQVLCQGFFTYSLSWA